MATKFIQLDEAAEQLGISPDKLNEMRERNEIRGFRDGQTWKFKEEEIAKLGANLKGGGGGGGGDDELTLDLDDVGGGVSDSVLVSDRELGGSDVMGSGSAIIGDKETPDSDIELADAGSGPQIISDSMLGGSDLSLDPIPGGAGEESGLQIDEGDSLELELESDIGKGKSSLDEADLTMAGESDLSLADADDMTLGEGGSGFGADSAIDLTGDDDEDLVLGGTGSDVTIGASDSGISLSDPADSGISLEDPLELGGSAIGDESLVLGEDDMISLGDDVADPSAATQLKSDDDFLLTPLDDASGEESESGSQVIALDESGGFDQSAATLLGGGDQGVAMLEEDVSDADTMIGGPGMARGPAAVAAPQGAAAMIMQPAIPEAPYSIWNVLSMFVCIILLSFIGMMSYDVVRQIWSWEGAHPVNSGLMDSFINTFMK
jgi:excisionase family DNA binding protein